MDCLAERNTLSYTPVERVIGGKKEHDTSYRWHAHDVYRTSTSSGSILHSNSGEAAVLTGSDRNIYDRKSKNVHELEKRRTGTNVITRIVTPILDLFILCLAPLLGMIELKVCTYTTTACSSVGHEAVTYISLGGRHDGSTSTGNTAPPTIKMQIYPLTPPSSFDLKANAPSLDPLDDFDLGPPLSALQALEREKGVYSAELNSEEQLERKRWLAGGRGRKGLRIMIVTENFLPKVDGVTRTLARLLEHLEAEGHECMVLGPNTGMVSRFTSHRLQHSLISTHQTHYASHPLVGTLGVPLMVYPGLKVSARLISRR